MAPLSLHRLALTPLTSHERTTTANYGRSRPHINLYFPVIDMIHGVISQELGQESLDSPSRGGDCQGRDVVSTGPMIG
jgi:hypothetical protein